MGLFLIIFLTSFAIALIAFIGVLFLIFKEGLAKRICFWLISFAVGTLLGATFLDILPEAVEFAEKAGLELHSIFLYTILGIFLFFLLEKFLILHHCAHKDVCEIHRLPSPTLILVGDFIHNLIDGILLGVAFLASISLGIIVAISVALHEIPQEIGDFGILIGGGLSRKKAIIWNFIVALPIILGALGVYFIAGPINIWIAPALALTAGGFIYIALACLIPQLHHVYPIRIRTFLIQTLLILLGLLMIFLVGEILPY